MKGFFRIDSDLLRGKPFRKLTRVERIKNLMCRVIDSEYTHETSGCTVIVALLTKENVLYVVSLVFCCLQRERVGKIDKICIIEQCW